MTADPCTETHSKNIVQNVNSLVVHQVANTPVYPIIQVSIRSQKVYIVVDNMSGQSYITDRLVQQLNLKVTKREHSLHVSGFGAEESNIVTHLASIKIQQNENEEILRLNIVKHISKSLPAVDEKILEIWKWLNTQKLSSDFPRPMIYPQILIGLDYL